jgi:TRAP-type C4-dicarboxylate transport system substrate-binding protein
MKELSGGKVTMTIFAGGVAGDEGDMVRKMRIGALHAATITNIGLSKITRASIALQIPMMIRSYEELDYVRDHIAAKLSAEMEKNGFVVLSYGDAGWVHFFSNEPSPHPDDFKKTKFFVWSGDPESEGAWKRGGFKTVPLSATDVLTSLSSGLIDSFSTAPLYAETSQWFSHTKYMLDLNWTPLNGATIITKKIWDQIDPELRPKIAEVAKEEGKALNEEVRKLDDKSIKAMTERGLKVIKPDQAAIDEWQKTAENAYSEIRGKVVPEEYFDEVQRLVKEFRAQQKK